MQGPSATTTSRDTTWLSLVDAANYLGLSQAALLQAVQQGELSPASQAGIDPPTFPLSALDTFLANQQARAIITGKLTMPLKLPIDLPRLLSSMVAMPDEREAADALANEVRALAGPACPAVVILRIEESTESIRLLAVSDLPVIERLSVIADRQTAPVQARLWDLDDTFRSAVQQERAFETAAVEAALAPVLGEGAGELCEALSLRGLVVSPLLNIGGVRWLIGLLLDDDPRELRPETRRAIEALSIQASIALEAVRLREDVLRRANRAEALYGTVRMLARSEDSRSLLERIASLATRLLATDAGAVLIYHSEDESLRTGAAVGLDTPTGQFAADLSSSYLVGRAAGMTRPLQISDTSHTATLSLPRLAGNRRTMAAGCAPVIHRGTLLGAIEVYSATPRTFSPDDMELLGAFAHHAAIALQALHTQETRRRELLGAVEALAGANEARDGYTGEHCKRLGRLAMMLARSLGFSEEEVERIGLAAALHDIGKIAIPDAILRKPGPLTEKERAIVQLHPETGEEIVARVPELQDVARMIGAHQERWDGKGYPNGLAGTDIPLGARIIAVVDTYAALVEDRPYRTGVTHEEAIREIVASGGSQLDPQIVAVFAEVRDTVRQLMAETGMPATNGKGEGTGALRCSGVSPKSSVPITTSYLPGHRWQLHRASELAALTDIIRIIASSRDLQAMYEQLHRKIGDLVDVDAMLVLLSDETSAGERKLPTLRRSGFFPVIGRPVELGVTSPVARLKRSLWVNDYHAYARERGIKIDDGGGQVPRSVIAVPLVVDETFLGLLSIQALHPAAYDKRHVGLVEEIGLHIGLALRNSRELDARAHHQISEPALVDPLTSLPHQATIIPRLREEIALLRERGQPVSLLFLGLDHFRKGSDAFGHRFGDEALVSIAGYLPRSLPSSAYISPYSGGEFVAILPRTPVESAAFLAEELRSDLAERAYTSSSGHSIPLSVSIGVAGVEPGVADIVTAEELFDCADRALAEARRSGRKLVIGHQQFVGA